MKKFIYSALAASMLFACSQEEIVDVNKSESQLMTFKVELPANASSRTVGGGIEIGAGTQADNLIYAMYEYGIEDAPVVTGVATDGEDNDGVFTVTVPMAKDITYDLLFLAYNKDNTAFIINKDDPKTTNLKALKFNASQTPNVDAYDAFVGSLSDQGITAAATTLVELRRPFAQVNAATALQDLKDAETLGAKVVKSNLVIKNVPTTYNVLSGLTSGSQTVNFKANEILSADALTNGYKNETIEVDGTTYYYLTLAYVLAGKDPSTHEATFNFFRDGDEVVSELNILNLPVQRNYRTNVLGSLVTKQENYTVSIDADFGVPTKEIKLWDGKTLKEPAYDETTKTYSIYNAAELAYIAALVNGTLDTDNVSRVAVSANSLKGVTVSLEDDIYLNNEEWTPIGNGSNHFQGTLEGKNHTIYGLKVSHRRDARAALFGTVSGTIAFRNIIFRDANIICPDFNGDFYGSALIGTAYGNVTIENVDVVDSYISGNNKVGALLAHDGVVSSLTIDGCDVSKVKFEATNIEDGGSVGGFVGYFQGVAKGTQAAPYGEHYIKNSTVKDCVFNVVNSTNTGKRANGLFMGGLESKANQKLYITNCTAENNNSWNEKFYVDGTEVTEDTFESPYNGLIGGERNDAPKGVVWINGVRYSSVPIAKVGNTEYKTIDEAIAAWTNNTTLTLLDDVTLSDVITIKSTEHHVLDLGTFTMTAAEGKDAFVIKACGTGAAERTAITIKADANKPGGINAGKKCIIYYKYADGGITAEDRPIIKIEGGVFTASTSSFGTAGIYTIGSEARKCATLNISGGTFNCSINGSGKSKLLISGGVFHYSVGSQGDSTALRLISGGTFKTLGFMTADSKNTKFWFGTSMANSNVGLYINDDNYLVVGGPVITGFGDKFAAKATNPTKWSSYLQYSSAAANGLYYTNADMAIAKHGAANVELK